MARVKFTKSDNVGSSCFEETVTFADPSSYKFSVTVNMIIKS